MESIPIAVKLKHLLQYEKQCTFLDISYAFTRKLKLKENLNGQTIMLICNLGDAPH